MFPNIMTTRFSALLLRSVSWAIFFTFLLNVSAVSAADYLGPVFPEDTLVDLGEIEPPPLPKRKPNPLLQRPDNRQVVFDNHDPISIIPQSLLYEEESAPQPRMIRQQRTPAQIPQAIDTDSVIFMDDGEVIQDEIIGNYTTFDTDGFITGPFPVAFGMGLLDNIALFSETTTFKTELSDGAGSLGIGEGINWSTALTPQGTFAGQFGVRAVQADLSRPIRSQLFLTAGLFKRFDAVPVQCGVAVDWLEDRSWNFGAVNLRQMRGEVSARLSNSLEAGFSGAFDVFWDRPSTVIQNDVYLQYEILGGGSVHDYYLLFIRKHLDTGGQVELRGGATAYGDIILSALGEVAISDRLAVNGGLSLLSPSSGPQANFRESWSMSLGVVVYFRGGAACRQINMYRPMFDVAGNSSFLPRIIGR